MKYNYKRPVMYPKQERAFFNDRRLSAVEASTKAGKALHVDATVVTPSGLRRIGDLAVGDLVCDPSGGTATVQGVYPQGEKDLYHVSFSDGAFATCCMEHLWHVVGPRGEVSVVQTSEIASWPEWKFRRSGVPTGIADFEAQPVPIDPYVLGVLLGDGSFSAGVVRLTNKDDYILGRVASEYNLKKYDSTGPYDYGVSHNPELHAAIVAFGLMGKLSHEKFVPDVYKYNSREVRLEILRGLLDTDGSVDRNGQANIEQTSMQLDEDIEFLVESLGGISSTRTKVGSYVNDSGERVWCKTVYRNNIRFEDASQLFSLPEKKLKTRPRKKSMKRTFRSIEPAGKGEAVCIKVDSADNLFMTDDFIVTHNTHAAIAWLFEKALIEGKPGRNYWWVAPVSAQAEIAFRRMKQAIPFRDLYKDNKVHQHITLLNGAMIWFKSADHSDSLYGEDVHGAVIDEASRCKEDSWHAVRSTVTATRGQLRLIGNVKGRNNWFYKLCRVAESGADPNMWYEKITAVDAVAAGVLDVEEIKAARRIYPENVFRELYLADPSDDHGNPFGFEYIERCIFRDDEGKPTVKLAEGPPVAFGWDVAKSMNWTVGIGLNRHGNVCVFHRWKDSWEGTISKILSTTRNVAAYVDSTGGGDPIGETLQRRGGPNFKGMKFSRQSKQDLMVLLATGIQQSKIGYPDGDIVKELSAFEYEISNSGNVLYSAPKGVHDDCVDALAMAYKMLREQQFTTITVSPIEIKRDSPWAIR
jgi:hypothetical protein